MVYVYNIIEYHNIVYGTMVVHVYVLEYHLVSQKPWYHMVHVYCTYTCTYVLEYVPWYSSTIPMVALVHMYQMVPWYHGTYSTTYTSTRYGLVWHSVVPNGTSGMSSTLVHVYVP